MFGQAGWCATPGADNTPGLAKLEHAYRQLAKQPKIKRHSKIKGVAGPDGHRINAGGGPKDVPRSTTRQSMDKERALLARAERVEDGHG